MGYYSFEDFKKLIHPLWTPEDIKVHPNSKYHMRISSHIFLNILFPVTYATNEEIRDALNTTNQDFDQPRKMMLDVYTSTKASKSGLQPVLVSVKVYF